MTSGTPSCYWGDMETKIIPASEFTGFSELQKVLSGLPALNLFNGPWVAGGAARRLLVGESVKGGDIDIFFKAVPQLGAFRRALAAKAVQEFKTKYAETYHIEVDGQTYRVQLITRKFYSEGLPMLFRDFDFTACQLAFDGSHVIAKLEAYEDIMAGKLKFAADGRTNAKNLVRRTLKYIQYGFTPIIPFIGVNPY